MMSLCICDKREKLNYFYEKVKITSDYSLFGHKLDSFTFMLHQACNTHIYITRAALRSADNWMDPEESDTDLLVYK